MWMLLKLHSLICYLSTRHGALRVFFAFVLGEEAEPGAWEWICQLEFGYGVQTFSCMCGDQEESSEEGIQVAFRPPGSYHLAFPRQQLARIRKKSPECGIYKGLVEEGAWGISRQKKAAKGGLTCQPES